MTGEKLQRQQLRLLQTMLCIGLLMCGLPVLPAAYGQQSGGAKPAAGGDCTAKLSPEAKEILEDRVVSAPLINLLKDLGALESVGRYPKGDDFRFVFGFNQAKNAAPDIEAREATDMRWLWVANIDAAEKLDELLDWRDDARFYRKDEKFDGDVSHGVITLEMKDGELSLRFDYEQKSPDQAQQYATLYNQVFTAAACEYQATENAVVYQNTKALAEKDHFVITTRLARAALDKLRADLQSAAAAN